MKFISLIKLLFYILLAILPIVFWDPIVRSLMDVFDIEDNLQTHQLFKKVLIVAVLILLARKSIIEYLHERESLSIRVAYLMLLVIAVFLSIRSTLSVFMV